MSYWAPMRRESAGGRSRPVGRVGGVVLAALLALPAAKAAAGSFVNFESGHVRPHALSPAGAQLVAVNTPGSKSAQTSTF
jgi:hypothetical protein